MEKNEQANSRNPIPQNDPSKAMDSKREVEQSPDEKTDQDFPGYPHYPAKEDIMSQNSGAHRVDADVEELSAGNNRSGVSQRFPSSNTNDESRNEEMGIPQNVSNEDLDSGRELPGSDLDDAAEAAEDR